MSDIEQEIAEIGALLQDATRRLAALQAHA